MNIFILDRSPIKAAQYHADKHVVKMILESAQMLSTAVRHYEQVPYLYKAAYKNHPCTKWAQSSKENFVWLCDLAESLCAEYTYRYGKEHKSGHIIQMAKKYAHLIPTKTLTPFAQAMPNQYKHENAVKAYRDYYIHEKRLLLIYTKREVPYWLKGMSSQK